MSSGKSTVGAELARRLGCRFIDLDRAIEEDSGMTIPEIFNAEGEAGFRTRESSCLIRILKTYRNENSTTVLALGGGTPVDKKNRLAIRENTFCIYLNASADVLHKRLQSACDGRPMLTKRASGNPEALYDRINNLLNERKGIYEECSDLTIDTDSPDISRTAEKIMTTAALRRPAADTVPEAQPAETQESSLPEY